MIARSSFRTSSLIHSVAARARWGARPIHGSTRRSEAGLAKVTPSRPPPHPQQRLSSSESSLPPDHFTRTPAPSQPDLRPDGRPLSKHEYELQVGRAIDILRATLQDFMRIGLSDYGQEATHSTSSPGVVMGLNLGTLSGGIAKLFDADDATKDDNDAAEPENPTRFPSIYHSGIAFRFRPPMPSSSGSRPSAGIGDHWDTSKPSPEGGPAISFHGKTMYLASAHFLRHALSVLFADTNIGIESMQLVKSQDVSSKDSEISLPSGPDASPSTSSRRDELVVRLRFEGQFRVTGTPHIYTAVFRYLFDPSSGQIIRHSVESIQPAPGRKVIAGLATIWSRLVGEQQQQPSPTAATSHSIPSSLFSFPKTMRR